MGTTCTLVSFAIGQQPEVIFMNNLVLQQYFLIMLSSISKFADKNAILLVKRGMHFI